MSTSATHLAVVRWGLAATLACAGYFAAVHFELPAFYYYPMEGAWHWSVPANEAALGPRITYYGWKVSGLLVMPLAWLLPPRLAQRLPASLGLWGVSAMTLLMLAVESRWFLM